MTQLSFFPKSDPKPFPSGEELKKKGMTRAVKHAEDLHPDWQKKALDFLYIYLKNHSIGHRFSGEMVRVESKGIVPTPPHLRSWGAVFLNASRRGWIKKVGHVTVSNPSAHACFASEWESCL